MQITNQRILPRLRCLAVLFAVFVTSHIYIDVMAAVSTVNVPVGHWSYVALERLKGFGLVHSDLQGTRPFSRMEMARLVNEALTERDRSDNKMPPIIVHLLKKLSREFKEELNAFNRGNDPIPETCIKPVDELQMRYVYVDGEPRVFKGFPKTGQIIHATEGTPQVINNDGIVYGQHNNLTAQFSSSMRFMNVFSAYVEPIAMVRQNTGNLQDFQETKVDLLKGYAKFSPWNMEIEAGRDTMWWGQGYHGSLLLSNNAFPLDMLKLTNPTPFLLPWYFSYFGPFKYTIFVARLEDDRVDFPHPLLGGMRLNFKPIPTLELGLSLIHI